MTKNKIPAGLVGLIIGLLLGYFTFRDNPSNIKSIREISADYKFINPLLFIQVPEESAFPQYRHLKNSLENYVSKTTSGPVISNISIYFRNLNSSQWVGINHTEKFSPASMLKVITLIATLREAEINPGILKSTAFIKGDDGKLPNNIQTYYPPEDPVIVGQSYTVDKLLQHLIIDSDNIANNALHEIIGTEKINKTYKDLELPTLESGSDNYTPQQYSHLFRAIHNGTYLSRNLSEKVLELLSQTNFDKGLVAGVPENTTVSHKFGVRNILSEDGKPGDEPVARELHDCGIIYYPENPYFLCVMTRGKNFVDLEGAIKDISKITWDEVKRLNN